MFKRKKEEDKGFDFGIEISPVDEEQYGTKKKSKLRSFMYLVVVPFIVFFLLAGLYVRFTGTNESTEPKQVVPPKEDVVVEKVKTTAEIEKEKEKTKQAFEDIPKGYVIYTNGFLSLASLVKADWVVLEKTQEAMNDITPYMKEGVFDWKKAKLKKPIYVMDLISPIANKPPLIRTYLSSTPTNAKFVASLFSISAKPVGGVKTKTIKIDKKKVKLQEYKIKDFKLKVTAVRVDKKIGNLTFTTVLIGEAGKEFNDSIESWYKTATSVKQFKPDGKKK